MSSRAGLTLAAAIGVLAGCATPAPPAPPPVAAPVESAPLVVVPPATAPLIEYPPLEPVEPAVMPGVAAASVVATGQ